MILPPKKPKREGIYSAFDEGFNQAIDETAKLNEWKTIDSAPRDGSKIWAHLKDGETATAWFDNRTGDWETEHYYLDSGTEPTHWKPLPEPPKEQSEVENG